MICQNESCNQLILLIRKTMTSSWRSLELWGLAVPPSLFALLTGEGKNSSYSPQGAHDQEGSHMTTVDI